MSSEPTHPSIAAVVAAAEPDLRERALRRLPTDRFAGRFSPGATRAFVLEAIHEGWLMHYGRPRVFRDMDEDLSLLGGDAMFALGLERVAAEGDLEAVAELADLISLTARAVAEGHPEWTDALWRATVDRLAESRDDGASAAFAALAPEDHRRGPEQPPTAGAKPYP